MNILSMLGNLLTGAQAEAQDIGTQATEAVYVIIGELALIAVLLALIWWKVEAPKI